MYLTEYQLRKECEKCLTCDMAQCSYNCPIGINPSYYIKEYKSGHKDSAISYLNNYPFVRTLGHLCSEEYCMKNCHRKTVDSSIRCPAIQATLLKDTEPNKLEYKYPNTKLRDKRVAVVGGGLAGLTAVQILVLNGIKTTLYEESDKLGGVLNYISEDKLPKEVLEKELSIFTESSLLEIKLNTNKIIPSNLKYEYDGVIIATGIEQYNRLDIEGSNYITDYKNFLEAVYHYNCVDNKKYKKIFILGGGNMAADCALLAHKLGIETSILYRDSIYKMKMSKSNFNKLIENKIDIFPHINVTDIIPNTKDCKYSYLLYDNHLPFGDCDAVICALGGTSSNKEKIEQEYPEIIYIGECSIGSASAVDVVNNSIKKTLALLRYWKEK